MSYVAFLLRTHFLTEASGRDRFLEEHPVTRVYHASLRLPRMHHIGWTGKRTSSQTPYSWAVWDRRADPELPRRFNWRDIWREYEAGRLDLGPNKSRLLTGVTPAVVAEVVPVTTNIIAAAR